MIRLRPFKKGDAKKLLSWFDDERTMVMWCSGIFQYPLTEEQLLSHLQKAEEREDQWMLAGVDEQGTVTGHLCMWMDFEKNHVHLGLIAVDNARRGQGLGRQMLEKALTCAFDVLEADYVTLGVFDCNPQAYACYRKVGFVEDHVEAHAMEYCGESWSRIHMVKKRTD